MKNKAVIIILFILVAIISVVIGIGIGVNLPSKEAETNKDTSIENKQDLTNNENTTPTDNITQEQVEELIEKELSQLVAETSLAKLTNQDKLQILLDIYENKTNNGHSETISLTSLDDVYKNSCIRNLSIEYEDITHYMEYRPVPETRYNLNEDTYICPGDSHHGASMFRIIYKKVIDYINTDNKIIISYKYGFYTSEGDGPSPVNIYYTYDDAINGRNKVKTYNQPEYDDDYQAVLEMAENYDFSSKLDKLNTYTYTFEIIDNELILIDFNRK